LWCGAGCPSLGSRSPMSTAPHSSALRWWGRLWNRGSASGAVSLREAGAGGKKMTCSLWALGQCWGRTAAALPFRLITPKHNTGHTGPCLVMPGHNGHTAVKAEPMRGSTRHRGKASEGRERRQRHGLPARPKANNRLPKATPGPVACSYATVLTHISCLILTKTQ